MSEVDEKTITKVGHLARLNIEGKELAENAKNITQILDLVEKINSIDVDGLAPLANPLDAVLTLRPDEVTESNQREELLALAPETEAGLFLVPKVIE